MGNYTNTGRNRKVFGEQTKYLYISMHPPPLTAVYVMYARALIKVFFFY